MATLKLPKAELIARLEARKAEIAAEYKEAEDSTRAELNRRANLVSDAEAYADYYEMIATGLRDGTYEMSNGKLRPTRRGDKVPPRPGTKDSAVELMRGIRGGGSRFSYYADSQLTEKIERQWPAQLAEELKPIDTAIDLLNIATDDVVEVDASNYAGMLSGDRRQRYFL